MCTMTKGEKGSKKEKQRHTTTYLLLYFTSFALNLRRRRKVFHFDVSRLMRNGTDRKPDARRIVAVVHQHDVLTLFEEHTMNIMTIKTNTNKVGFNVEHSATSQHQVSAQAVPSLIQERLEDHCASSLLASTASRLLVPAKNNDTTTGTSIACGRSSNTISTGTAAMAVARKPVPKPVSILRHRNVQQLGIGIAPARRCAKQRKKRVHFSRNKVETRTYVLHESEKRGLRKVKPASKHELEISPFETYRDWTGGECKRRRLCGDGSFAVSFVSVKQRGLRKVKQPSKRKLEISPFEMHRHCTGRECKRQKLDGDGSVAVSFVSVNRHEQQNLVVVDSQVPNDTDAVDDIDAIVDNEEFAMIVDEDDVEAAASDAPVSAGRCCGLAGTCNDSSSFFDSRHRGKR